MSFKEISLDVEEEIEPAIDAPSEIMRYLDKPSGKIFEFQKFPNLGTYKKFSSELITNYVVLTVRLGPDTIYGKRITPKQMERMIQRLTPLLEED